MSDLEPTLSPDPALETSRLDRIEARLATLEDRLAGAGAAPPPLDPPPADPAAAPAFTAQGQAWLAKGNDFVRNNPVVALLAGVLVLVLLSHLLD